MHGIPNPCRHFQIRQIYTDDRTPFSCERYMQAYIYISAGKFYYNCLNKYYDAFYVYDYDYYDYYYDYYCIDMIRLTNVISFVFFVLFNGLSILLFYHVITFIMLY